MKSRKTIFSVFLIFFILFSLAFLVFCAGDDDDDGRDDDHDDDDHDGDDDNGDDDDDDQEDDDDDDDDDDSHQPSYPIVDVQVEDGITYRFMNSIIPQWTGDLWPSAWGDDDRLYIANGDGFGFGLIWGDIVFNIVDGLPTDLVGSTPPLAFGPFLGGLWGPDILELGRKPTGLVCVDNDLYMFVQNLKNGLSENPFGDAPHASVSVSRDHGQSWEYETSAPMFTDHIFTTGFFLDYGKCQQHAKDEYTYVYGLDYNYRYSEGFDQTKMFLARVSNDRIMDIEFWEFVVGFEGEDPLWSTDIESKIPVLEDDTLYHGDKSGIAQGSVVYLSQHNRYLYSTRAQYEWIFYEAGKPWGPWTKVSVIEWTGGWTEEFHAGYNAVIPTKYLEPDDLGGWIISSLSDSWFDGMYYNMGLRRFWLEVSELPE